MKTDQAFKKYVDWVDWYRQFIRLCAKYDIHNLTGEHLLVESIRTIHFEKGHTPEFAVINILKERIARSIEHIKQMDSGYITDTDRLEWVFTGEEAFFKPSGYDGRDDGRWDIYFPSLMLTQDEANFRDDIDAVMSNRGQYEN